MSDDERRVVYATPRPLGQTTKQIQSIIKAMGCEGTLHVFPTKQYDAVAGWALKVSAFLENSMECSCTKGEKFTKKCKRCSLLDEFKDIKHKFGMSFEIIEDDIATVVGEQAFQNRQAHYHEKVKKQQEDWTQLDLSKVNEGIKEEKRRIMDPIGALMVHSEKIGVRWFTESRVEPDFGGSLPYNNKRYTTKKLQVFDSNQWIDVPEFSKTMLEDTQNRSIQRGEVVDDCPYCGAKRSKGQRYCENCGNNFPLYFVNHQDSRDD